MEKKEYYNSVKLTPDEGNYLYNGKFVAQVVHAPLDADLSIWQEISQEEGDNIKAEQAKAREEELQAAIATEEAERKAREEEMAELRTKQESESEE